MSNEIVSCSRNELDRIEKMKDGDLREFAKQKTEMILAAVYQLSGKIKEAKEAGLAAESIKTGLLHWGGTREKADHTAKALVQTNDAIAELSKLQQETILFTCLSARLAKFMREAIKNKLAEEIINVDGSVVRLDKETENFANYIINKAEDFGRKQSASEERNEKQDEMISRNHSLISENRTLIEQNEAADRKRDGQIAELQSTIVRLQKQLEAVTGERLAGNGFAPVSPITHRENTEYRETGFVNENEGFVRSVNHRLIGGVCGGLAHKFGMSPMAVRIGFMALCALWGIGIPVYILLMFAIRKCRLT